MATNITPFTFVDAINFNKTDIIRDGDARENDYNPFLVNRALSYFPDTIFDAAEMNARASLPNIAQFDYLRLSIRKKKRFSKWGKKSNEADVKAVAETFGYSIGKAREAIRCLTEDQMNMIRVRIASKDVGK